MFLQESLELLKRMKRLEGPGGNEYIKEDNDEEVLKGIIRKVRYDARGRRLRLKYMGKIEYIDIPANLATRKQIFKFIDELFQKINKAIHPIKIESEMTANFAYEEPEEKEEGGEEEKEKSEKEQEKEKEEE